MALAECNYDIHDKEMLAIVKSLDQWRSELQRTAKRI
jgi:RNase H-like domain found in reverse transcriptase